MSGYYRNLKLEGTPGEIVELLLRHQGAYLSLKLVESLGGNDSGVATSPVVIDVYGKFRQMHEKPRIFQVYPDGLEPKTDDEGIALICNDDGENMPLWTIIMRLLPGEQRCVNIESLLADPDVEKHKEAVLRSDKTSIQPSVRVSIRAPANRCFLSVWVED